MNKQRYLPIFNEDETWIDRPDLYLLARMGHSDECHETEVLQVYDIMRSVQPGRAEFTRLEKDIHDRYVCKNLRLRIYAGQVFLELIRIAASTSKTPRKNDALRLATDQQARHDEGQHLRARSSLQREMDKGFSMYRSTVHLQAALVFGEPAIDEVEGSEEMTRRFLARARGFEQFGDKAFEGGQVTWEPWRVPASIPAIPPTGFPPLTPDELAMVKTANAA